MSSTAGADPQTIHSGTPLPATLLGSGDCLSPEAKSEIKTLMQPAPAAFVFEALKAWTFIFGAAAFALRLHQPLVSLLAVFFIATRQNVLGLLVHEQSHYLAFRSKQGELAANALAAWPLLVSVDGYADVHLSHHAFYFTEKDPDYRRKRGTEWETPLQPKRIRSLLLKDITGLNVGQTLKGKKMKESLLGKRRIATPAWCRIVFYALAAGVITALHGWTAVALYWLLPLLTILQVFIRWGALCEHKYNLKATGLDESTPLIKLKGWERALFPNLNFTYHIYHHLYPAVPFCHLPKIHRIFQRERKVNELNVFRGYGRYLHFLFRTGELLNVFRTRTRKTT